MTEAIKKIGAVTTVEEGTRITMEIGIIMVKILTIITMMSVKSTITSKIIPKKDLPLGTTGITERT
jgi:hypothetical protein